MKQTILTILLLLFPLPALAQSEALRSFSEAGTLPTSSLSFHGYPCTKDCAAHRAGFDRAKEQALTAREDCRAETTAETEGCLAYIESLSAEYGNEAEMDEDYYAENYGTAE